MKKALSNKRILLIDDNVSLVETLRMLLSTRGYEVDPAFSGEEAIKKISARTDLILLDIALPDIDGFKLCRKLKDNEKSSHIPIIILSARVLSEDIIEGLYLGADDYITKPFECEELIARIEAVIRRSRIHRENHFSYADDEYLISEIRKIIDQEMIVPFFQPIFNLKTFEWIGVEVLSRPSTSTKLSNPELLFKIALQLGFYHELEIISWKKALRYASKNLRDKMLFLNCDPYLIEGNSLKKIQKIFETTNMPIDHTVLEITERSAVKDFDLFYNKLKEYRNIGFKFAIDDVGGGYASLESIVEIMPEMIKIDRHIIANGHKNIYKKSLIKFIVSFCKENNILSIAEGIETKKELQTVINLDVDAGQGYYLQRPITNIISDNRLAEKMCIS